MEQQFPHRLQEYVVKAVEEPLKEQALDVKRTDVYEEDFSLFNSVAILAIMADNFRGTMTLCVDQTLLESSHPMAKAGRALTDALVADWLGELANLTVGRFKLLLSGHGINARITPPSIESSVEKVLKDFEQLKPTQRFWFAVGSDTALCQLSVEFDETVDFEAEPTAMYM